MSFVGCFLSIPRTAPTPPVRLHHRTPLENAVPHAPFVPDGYLVRAFEAQHQFPLWQERLFASVVRRAEERQPDFVAIDPHADVFATTSQARVWFDQVKQRSAVIADIELLHSRGLLACLAATFALQPGTFDVFVEPDQIGELLDDKGLSDTTGDVIYDPRLERVRVLRRRKAVPTTPRPRPGSLGPVYEQCSKP